MEPLEVRYSIFAGVISHKAALTCVVGGAGVGFASREAIRRLDIPLNFGSARRVTALTRIVDWTFSSYSLGGTSAGDFMRRAAPRCTILCGVSNLRWVI